MHSPPEALPRRHVLTLPALPSSVRAARETAEQVWAEWGIAYGHPAVGPALLILSELVANAVRHAAVLSPQVTVVHAADDACLAFAVHDRHPYRPPLHEASLGAGGLGVVMELVHGLGGAALVRPDPGTSGKSVWIALPL